MIDGKRSMGYSTLAIIILLLVLAYVLLTNTNTFAGILKKGGDIEVCRLSVLAQASVKLAGQSPLSLKCPRREIKLFNDKVEINGKKEAKYEFKKLDDNIVNKIVAEELRLCWYKMGEGEVNVFQQAYVTEIDTVCLICSEISFDQKLENKQFQGLVDYLKGNKMHETDIYYFDYLIRSQRNTYLLWGNIPWSQYTPWGWGTTDRITNNVEENLQKYKEGSNSLVTNKNYVIYFLAHKPDWLTEFIGVAISAHYIGLGDNTKVAKECRRLVN